MRTTVQKIIKEKWKWKWKQIKKKKIMIVIENQSINELGGKIHYWKWNANFSLPKVIVLQKEKPMINIKTFLLLLESIAIDFILYWSSRKLLVSAQLPIMFHVPEYVCVCVLVCNDDPCFFPLLSINSFFSAFCLYCSNSNVLQ